MGIAGFQESLSRIEARRVQKPVERRIERCFCDEEGFGDEGGDKLVGLRVRENGACGLEREAPAEDG
ncbi:hypothetical protein T190_32210 [Sinorhizobium meliloti CCBAU 01290]|nr:hypothetical protein T190_32210 [Sinorhizobium meliloti CCBAU 01290]